MEDALDTASFPRTSWSVLAKTPGMYDQKARKIIATGNPNTEFNHFRLLRGF